MAGLRGHARVDFSVHPEIPCMYGLPVSLELGFQCDDKGHLETIAMNVRETNAVTQTYANHGAAARLMDDARPRCLLARPPMKRPMSILMVRE